MTLTAATGVVSPPYAGSGALTWDNAITFSGALTFSGAVTHSSTNTFSGAVDINNTVDIDATTTSTNPIVDIAQAGTGIGMNIDVADGGTNAALSIDHNETNGAAVGIALDVASTGATAFAFDITGIATDAGIVITDTQTDIAIDTVAGVLRVQYDDGAGAETGYIPILSTLTN